MLRREQSSCEAEIGLKPKASNTYFSLITSPFCHRKVKMKRDHLSKTPVPFSLSASRHREGMSIPTTEYSWMSDLKKLNPLAENTFQKSIKLLFLPARTLPSIAEGWRQIPAAAQHPLSTSDPSSLQSLPRGQIKQKDLATEPACALPGTQAMCTQTSKGVSLTWDMSSLFGIFCNYPYCLT